MEILTHTQRLMPSVIPETTKERNQRIVTCVLDRGYSRQGLAVEYGISYEYVTQLVNEERAHRLARDPAWKEPVRGRMHFLCRRG